MSMKVNKVLPLPAELKEEYPLSEELIRLKKERDTEIRDIFTGKSDKFAVIIGPCSTDNEDSVCEYVSRLAKVNEKVKDRLMLIPRIYTNKPRTTGEGYKGMLHQPDPDKAPDLYAGIMAIRKMHIRAMKESGLTAADEMLYPENRSYLDDILSYEAVGARSVDAGNLCGAWKWSEPGNWKRKISCTWRSMFSGRISSFFCRSFQTALYGGLRSIRTSRKCPKRSHR